MSQATFTYETWRIGYDLVVVAVVVGNFVYTWIANRTKANTSAIEGVNQSLTAVVRRVDRLEQSIKIAPTHKDLEQLYRRMDEMNGELKQVHGEISGSTTTLNLIHDYLLRGNR